MESRDDIAIVGMACVYPGAPDLRTYWRNITSKVDAISDPPEDMWDVDVYYDPASSTNDRVYCKKGGFIGPIATFDPLANGVMPLAVEGGEPDQWLALKVARAALADAGYGDEIPERHRTAVILGKGTYLNRGNLSVLQHGSIVDQTLATLKTLHPEFTEADLQAIRKDLKRNLPPFNADTAPGLIPNIIAGRIANRLDLMGPSYTVDAACASSLLAVEHAVRGLRSREFDLAVVGGVHVATPAPVLMLFCQLGALSRREQIRPFDKNADGTLLAAGVGIVVLKRKSDAERDGQRIYAAIKGVGIASDGRGVSVMAPRLEGEVLALEKAYQSAGVVPRTVGLVEAHGTGTPVGDATEVQALGRVFGPRQDQEPWCALGSVKSMIGHAMPAAGMAGLIKVALALHHKVLPPTLNVEEPNPELGLDRTPFYLNTESRPWIHAGADAPRRAGVNSFGFGGINAHAILEECPAPPPAAESDPLRWDSEVCILAAATRADLVGKAERLRDYLRTAPAVELADVAYSLNVPSGEGAVRLAIVATSLDDLAQKLDRALVRLADPRTQKIKDVAGIYFFAEPLKPAGRLAFLFPGEGSQYVNMLGDLCVHFPEVRKWFDLIDGVFANHTRNYVPSDFIYPRPAFSDEERVAAEKRLWELEGAFEAVLTASWALFNLLSRLDIQPDVLLGHSTGEYAAMNASGMIALPDEEHIARFATDLNGFHYQQLAGGQEVPQAALVAVGADSPTVSAVAAAASGKLHLAMDNCPHQTVVAGGAEEAASFIDELRRRGLIYERLPFDRPYHTPLFAAYSGGLAAFFSRWLTAPPRIPLYSCTSQKLFPQDLAESRELAVQHWMKPVEFQKTVEGMYADGVRLFVEVGPRGNLTSFVEDILRGKPHVAAAADTMSRPGTTQLNHLVGLLAAHGVPMRLDYLYARRAPRRVLDAAGAAVAEAAPAKRGRPMKLAIGWIHAGLSEEMAAKLRGSASARPAAQPAMAAPPAAASAPVAPAPPVPLPANGVAAATVPPPVAAASAPARAAAPRPGADQVLSSYWQTMDQFLSMQQDVMQAFLSGRPAGAAMPAPANAPVPPVAAPQPPAHVAAPAVAPAPAVVPAPPVAPAAAVPPPAAPPAAPAAGPPALSAAAVSDLLLKIVADRTGYPVEMIDVDLDLEADLGIDSIKRVEILGSLQQQTGLMREHDMEALAGRKTLRQVSEFLTNRAEPENGTAVAPPAAAKPASPALGPVGPLLGRIVSHEPGRQLVAVREVGLAEDRYLRDHILGRDLSALTQALSGLPVMPLTMSMEILAEAAVALSPGRRLVGMRDVRAYRWMALEGEKLTLRVVASAKPDTEGREVRVQAFDADAPAGGGVPTPIVEGTMVLAEAYPEPPGAAPLALAAERPSRWAPEDMYRTGMFHGPAFRGVASMDRWGEDGATATLRTLPADELFESTRRPSLATDPVLMDQPGQVVGLWTAEHLENGFVVFPFQLEALHLYGPPPAAGRTLRCQARIALVGDQQVRSDLDVVDENGRVLARLLGWWDRRFDLPRHFMQFLQAPREGTLGRAWPAPLSAVPAAAGLVAWRVGTDDFPEAFLTSHGGVWQRVLAYTVLSKAEREAWRALRVPEARRVEWLLGRVAAKCALRAFLEARHGLRLSPADVEVLPDAEGRPVPGGAWTRGLGALPILSLSHAGGVAVAVAGDAGAAAGVGVDVEQAGRMGEDADRIAFTPDEQALLAGLDEAGRDTWRLRLWCAKEAVAKAVGLGLVGGPRAVVAEDLDAAAGTVRVRVTGEMAARVPAVNGRTLVAHTAREHDLVIATSLFTPQ